MARDRAAVSERAVVWLIALVQFVNVIDFMMVMPLGPDFARDLGIPLAQLGVIGGAYTAAAGLAGLAAALFIDRFDRRAALFVAMLGLVVGTLAGAFATGFTSLVVARVVAGAFGGPATALSLSVIADVVPEQRRGAAMGVVFSAFSVASVVGVPAGLEVARLLSWHATFVGVACIGLAGALATRRLLPSLRGHLDGAPVLRGGAALWGQLRQPNVILAVVIGGSFTMGLFAMVPNLAGYVQQNLGYPREHMGMLYLLGGVVSYATMRLGGHLVDRFGASQVGLVATLGLFVVCYLGFVDFPAGWPVAALFMGLMCANPARNLAYMTVAARVPRPAERAGFNALQSAVQHGASALGAVIGTLFLSEGPGGTLIGMDRVGWLAIGLGMVFPPLLFWLELRLNRAPAMQGTVGARLADTG